MSGADLEYQRMLRSAGINPDSPQGYDGARLAQLDDRNAVNNLRRVDVRRYGAKTDAESYLFDSTKAFQDAIDDMAETGGGVVEVSSGTRGGTSISPAVARDNLYRIGQVVVRRNTALVGTVGMFGAPVLAGTGDNDIIVFERDSLQAPGNNYVVPCTVKNLYLYGHNSSTKCGLNTVTEDGINLNLQHGVRLSHITAVNNGSDGVFIHGGSGVQDVDHIFGYLNGGYGLHIVGNEVQFINLFDIEGDGNAAGAALCIENTLPDYAIQITGLKSEQINNSIRMPGVVPAQNNALHLKNVQGRVGISGLQHISSAGNTYKPGDAVVISGANEPESFMMHPYGIRILPGQITGDDPNALRNEVVGGTIPVTISKNRSPIIVGALEPYIQGI